MIMDGKGLMVNGWMGGEVRVTGASHFLCLFCFAFSSFVLPAVLNVPLPSLLCYG